jgi:hypothetical protein
MWRYSRNHASATNGDECNQLLDHARYFYVGRYEKLALNEANPQGVPGRLLDLPKDLLDKIVKYTVDSSSSHELDFDSLADRKDLYGFLYANMWLHEQYINTFLLKQHFRLVTNENRRTRILRL